MLLQEAAKKPPNLNPMHSLNFFQTLWCCRYSHTCPHHSCVDVPECVAAGTVWPGTHISGGTSDWAERCSKLTEPLRSSPSACARKHLMSVLLWRWWWLVDAWGCLIGACVFWLSPVLSYGTSRWQAVIMFLTQRYLTSCPVALTLSTWMSQVSKAI